MVTRPLRVAAAIAVPALALAMLALILVPGSVWQPSKYDATYSGFDANLMYTSGSVRMTSDSLQMSAPPGSQPTANFFSTPLRHVAASMDASVDQNSGASEPLRVGVWSPWSGSGQFIVFGPPPQNDLGAETITNGIASTTLIGGQITNYTLISHYQLGRAYHLSFDVDKSNRTITSAVSAEDGTQGQGLMTAEESHAIFGPVQLSLTASAHPSSGQSRVVLTDYRMKIFHERVWATKVSDARAIWLIRALGVAGVIALLGGALALVTSSRFSLPRPSSMRRLPVVIAAAAIYLVGNVLLFPLGNHPFDMGDQQLFAYIARVYGTDQLFFLPNAVSLASVWGGVPYGEFAFPYEAATAYLSTATGWLYSFLFSGRGAFALADARLIYLIKSINVLFGLGDAALIYLILKRIGASERWSVIPAALFLFNPAVWFNMSIWGQTHVISLFLVLMAIFLAERRTPLWAWMFLAVACLTRPQMVVFGLLLGIVFLRKFPWRENVSAISWTAVAVFVAFVPLMLRTGPSLPVDIMLHNFNVQEAGGNNPALSTVSQGAYSIWPLVTYFAHGASGTLRAFTPSAGSLIGPLTYQRAGQLLTLLALVLVCCALWFRRQTRQEPGAYLPFVTLGVISFLMFLTGIVSTHFLLALPLLLMCRRWLSGGGYFFAVAAWSITTLVPMFGDMGIALMNHPEQLLSPDHNPVTKLAIDVYSWDRFITVGIAANVVALLWIAWQALRRERPSAVPV